jgi:hypothetical protein
MGHVKKSAGLCSAGSAEEMMPEMEHTGAIHLRESQPLNNYLFLI